MSKTVTFTKGLAGILSTAVVATLALKAWAIMLGAGILGANISYWEGLGLTALYITVLTKVEVQ